LEIEIMGKLTETIDFLTIPPDKLHTRFPYNQYYHYINIDGKLKKIRRTLKLWIENISDI